MEHQERFSEKVALKTGSGERLGFGWVLGRAFQGEEIVQVDTNAWAGKDWSISPASMKHDWNVSTGYVYRSSGN